MRVIVASETATFRTTVERVLRRGKHEVSTAETSDEVLSLLETTSIPYNLLILDQDLRGKSGIETLQIIRKDMLREFLLIVFISDTDDEHEEAEALNAHFMRGSTYSTALLHELLGRLGLD